MIMTVMSQYIKLNPQEFEAIVKSNNLRKSWYEKLNLKDMNYIQFIAEISKNPESVLADLDAETKDCFYKDLPEMLLPMAYEDHVVTGCKNLIVKIANKLKMKDTEMDDVKSIGLMVVRNCLWQYNKTSIVFATYAYRAISNRLLTYKNNNACFEKRNNVILFSRLSEKDDRGENYFVVDKSSLVKPSQTTMICKKTGSNLEIREIMYKVAKDELDNKIVDFYFVEGNKWVKELIKHIAVADGGKSISKAGLYKRFGNMVNRAKEYASKNANVYHAS